MRRITAITWLSTLLLATTLPVAAQQGPAVQAEQPATSNGARVERQIAGLQRQLRIGPAQQAQWDAFTAVMRDNARQQEAARTAPAPTLSAPDDLRARAAAAKVQADGLARLVPPFDVLYAALSPDQRAAADQAFQQFERRMHRGRAGTAG